MEPFLSFLLQHWVLSVAFVAIIFLLLLNEWRHRSLGMKSINVQQLVDLLNHSNGVVIDVRTTTRFEQGHILGAINIPQQELASRLNILNKYKSKPLVLVCHQGVDAAKSGRLLSQNGFTQLHYLAGGMEMWQSQGMPLIKK